MTSVSRYPLEVLYGLSRLDLTAVLLLIPHPSSHLAHVDLTAPPTVKIATWSAGVHIAIPQYRTMPMHELILYSFKKLDVIMTWS